MGGFMPPFNTTFTICDKQTYAASQTISSRRRFGAASSENPERPFDFSAVDIHCMRFFKFRKMVYDGVR